MVEKRCIKKYKNRRLYDVQTSSYINLSQLIELVQSGLAIEVVDAKTGADRTHEVLIQAILSMESVLSMFPNPLLFRMIRMQREGAMSNLMQQQLSTGLSLLDMQLEHMERSFRGIAP